MFVVGNVHEDEVFLPDPYIDVLAEYAEAAGVTLPTESAGPDWFDGVIDLPVEYEV